MKKLFSYTVMLMSLCFATACGNLIGVNSNAFEFRYPVTRCNGKVQVTDPEPVVLEGQEIDPDRGIWLMTPDVTVSPPKYSKREEDLLYIDKMSDFVGLRIENLFLQNEWIAGIQPFNLNDSPETNREELLTELRAQATRIDIIDYKQWVAPEALVMPDVPGYSLFLLLEGQIGLNKSRGKDNTLFLFLIDNAERQITYSDVLTYDCDIRNPDGLEKVMDHAYLKLLNVRFPETVSNTK